MKRTAEKLRFTTEERILLHLLDFVFYRREYEVSPSITQQGIAQGINIQKKHISRSLKALIEKELLLERTAHVTGKPQRMKTYLLTQNGEAKALELKNHIQNLIVLVKDKQGDIRRMTVTELIKYMGNSSTLPQILSHITREGSFDVKKIQEKQKTVETEVQQETVSIYKKALAQAWKDGKMTRDEVELLRTLRESLHISEKDHLKLEEEILENEEIEADAKAMEVYKVALEQALADNKISEDERAILEKIRKRFHIRDI